MTSFNAVNLFAEQLKRNIASEMFKTNLVITPSSLSQKGLYIQLSVLKTYPEGRVKTYDSTRTVRVRVSVRGTAESMTGLEMALDAIESLDDYLTQTPPNLEDGNGIKIPNTRIVTQINTEDSFIDSPDSITVQDVEDSRICLITIPREA